MLEFFLDICVLAVPLILLGLCLVPARLVNRQVNSFRQIVLSLVSAAFVVSVAVWLHVWWFGLMDFRLTQTEIPIHLSFGLYVDQLAAVMYSLISFVGVVIAMYSVRYLDGEATQGRFFKWIGFTIGAVLLMVISRNLAQLAGMWILTSVGLHQLLTHYSERPAAIVAAHKKFLISRLGDAALITAVVCVCQTYGTLEYPELFALLKDSDGATTSLSSLVIAFGFVIAAMAKSAQFPLHSWLPDTMETPTPVSALMHAGIINAGGFLMIRVSPVVAVSQSALVFLACIGAFTALFAAISMLTQTSVKRTLAYSTIAQMGFMMLQCGLEAYAAALLHLVAHSLYKAHAFLTSGSILEQAARRRYDRSAVSDLGGSLWPLPLAFVLAAGCLYLTSMVIGVDLTKKPGVIVLGSILLLALTQLLWTVLQTGRPRVIASGLGLTVLVCVAYFSSYLAVDTLLKQTVVAKPVGSTFVFQVVAGTVVLVIGLAAFTMQAALTRYRQQAWVKSLYVAALNGFNFDITVQKLVNRIWPPDVPRNSISH